MESHIVGHMVGTWLAMFCHVLSISFVPRLAEFEIEFEPSKTPVHQQPEHQISPVCKLLRSQLLFLALLFIQNVCIGFSGPIRGRI